MAELIKDSGQKIISDTLNKWGEKRKIFEKNINCTYSEEYKNLDSSLKKITSFIKKIKFFSEINFDLLMKEVKLLNLNRYISEIVSAILELKFKISNIGLLIKFISKIHRRYKKFSLQYFEALRKKLFAFSYEETEKELDRRNLKLFIKLYCDSIFYGLTTDTDIEIVYVVKFWKNLLQNDEENVYKFN
uniref:Regulator of nonsense transcripts UPF2 (Trinotate prediction) n=1 Tax=Henneguya salminicola TaxID=69463 RepID=A0A6G3MIW3_HENSL